MSTPLSAGSRIAVLLAAIGALVFDGVELGLMPVASLSVSQDLLGEAYSKALGGEWFAKFTAALMLGAAVGGIALGRLGDVIGRTRALGISVLFYSAFAGLGALVRTQEQMLLLRFVVGLGVGGVWPNAVSLAAECWPDRSRPVVAGLMGAALNGGILLLSQIGQIRHITPDSWRWIFWLAAAPAALGLAVLVGLPESPRWLASRGEASKPAPPFGELFRPPIRRATVVGILLGSIPMVGAWAASKWVMPWANDEAEAVRQAVGDTTLASYKSVTQAWWAVGAVLGSFVGANVAAWLGRRKAYAAISLGSVVLTLTMFLGTKPLEASFLPVVFAQGFVATLFFGWLPLYLPELFPTRVRAAGSGIAYNLGRFATAVGVFGAGALFDALGGSYPKVGAICGLVYALGLVVIWWAPDTTKKRLED